jgi:hypothetical protein
MAKKKTSPVARFMALPEEEKRRQLAEFDKEFVPTRAPTPEERRKMAKAQARGRGRPKVGEGAEKISLSVERGLLKRADALAKRRKITRAELVSSALQAELARDVEGARESMRAETYRKLRQGEKAPQNAL